MAYARRATAQPCPPTASNASLRAPLHIPLRSVLTPAMGSGSDNGKNTILVPFLLIPEHLAACAVRAVVVTAPPKAAMATKIQKKANTTTTPQSRNAAAVLGLAIAALAAARLHPVGMPPAGGM